MMSNLFILRKFIYKIKLKTGEFSGCEIIFCYFIIEGGFDILGGI